VFMKRSFVCSRQIFRNIVVEVSNVAFGIQIQYRKDMHNAVRKKICDLLYHAILKKAQITSPLTYGTLTFEPIFESSDATTMTDARVDQGV
jgi:hypothetical protein